MHVRGSRSESRTGLASAVCCYPLRAIFSPSAFLRSVCTDSTHEPSWARAGLLVRTVRSGEHQEWQILRTDTVLRYGCVLTVAVCHSRCLRASSNAPSRAQLLIGSWLRVCGTDGLQAHASGLGIVMGHDTKSVRCVLALESAFLRPRGPPTGLPATAGFHACGRILGCLHMIFVATKQCAATAQYTNSCSRGVCVVKCPCSRDLQ